MPKETVFYFSLKKKKIPVDLGSHEIFQKARVALISFYRRKNWKTIIYSSRVSASALFFNSSYPFSLS